jgi:hypothetical protein
MYWDAVIGLRCGRYERSLQSSDSRDKARSSDSARAAENMARRNAIDPDVLAAADAIIQGTD